MKVLEDLVIKPIITEKSLKLAEDKNQYSFIVDGKSNKIELSKAVEKMWKVSVEKVRTVRIRGKRVRFGRQRKVGFRSGIKKAVFTLKEGDKIDLFEIK